MTAFSSGLKVLMISAQEKRREEDREEKKCPGVKVCRKKGPAGGVITRGGSTEHKASPVYMQVCV